MPPTHHEKPAPTVATATQAEIAEALSNNHSKKERNCQFCGKPFFPSRSWQVFCSRDHARQYHSAVGRLRYEKLKAAYQQLLREYHELRAQLAKKEPPAP
jgi:hypothetical protein